MAGLGLDLGGTKIAARLCDGSAERDYRYDLTNDGDAGRELNGVLRFVGELARGVGKPIRACVLASAPTLDDAGIVSRWPNRPHWCGLALRPKLEEAIGCQVVVEDDGNAAAVAEASRRAARSLVYIGLGTGIGGGLVLDGHLYRGRGVAGEIGHMIVGGGGTACTCGRLGCLQAFASGPSVLRRAFGDDTAAAPEDRLREAFNAGDPAAVAALAEAWAALGRAILCLCELLDPEIVAIGGGFAAAFPELSTGAAAECARLARQGQHLPPILPALSGAQASLIGAAILACQEATR